MEEITKYCILFTRNKNLKKPNKNEKNEIKPNKQIFFLFIFNRNLYSFKPKISWSLIIVGDSLKKSPHFAVVNNIVPKRNSNSFGSPAMSTLLFIGGKNM